MKMLDALVNADIYFKDINTDKDISEVRNEIITCLSDITKQHPNIDFDVQAVNIREKAKDSK